MIATVVNALAIIAGSLVGLAAGGRIPERVQGTMTKALGLCVVFISILGITGVAASLASRDVLIVIVSIAFGAAIGELLDIDGALKRFGDWLEKRLKGRGGRVSEGFVTASLVFCVGAMAIVGSLQSGLSGNHETLFAKSLIDGISSAVFASTLGVGVIFSAVSVFVYQGTITLAAGVLKDVLTTPAQNGMTAAGSMLILAIGLNMLESTKIRVANLLPAVFLPPLILVLLGLFGG